MILATCYVDKCLKEVQNESHNNVPSWASKESGSGEALPMCVKLVSATHVISVKHVLTANISKTMRTLMRHYGSSQLCFVYMPAGRDWFKRPAG